MSRIRKYNDFILEDLFNLFKSDKSAREVDSRSHISKCVDEIISYLKENRIEDWNGFIQMTPFQRGIIDSLIDTSIKNMMELSEVRFEIRLRLSSKSQLKDMLVEYEYQEKYEKCDKILKKIKSNETFKKV